MRAESLPISPTIAAERGELLPVATRRSMKACPFWAKDKALWQVVSFPAIIRKVPVH